MPNVNVYITEEQYTLVHDEAKRKTVSWQKVVRDALDAYFTPKKEIPSRA